MRASDLSNLDTDFMEYSLCIVKKKSKASEETIKESLFCKILLAQRRTGSVNRGKKGLVIFRYLFALIFAIALQAAPPPDYLSAAIGAYDIYREKNRVCEAEIEYKFHLKCLKSPNRYLEFRPLVGLMATAKGSVYVYAGLNFDLLFFDHLLIVPGFAGGYYAPGKGKNLGYPIEFRTGVEVGWQFCNLHRLGMHFYHLSNAGLGRRNPGEESLVLFYDVPLIKGFPFIRDNK